MRSQRQDELTPEGDDAKQTDGGCRNGRFSAWLRSKLSDRLLEKGLTLGDFGFSFGQTIMVTLLPVLLAQHLDSPTLIGAVISLEGVAAILIPFAVGFGSDRLIRKMKTQQEARTVFLRLAAPVMAVSIAITPLIENPLLLAAAALVFFSALHTYRTPYLTLLSEDVPPERWGSVQGLRGGMHSAALGLALGTGGLFYSIWPVLPFLLSAAIMIVVNAVTVVSAHAIRENARGESESERKEILPDEIRQPGVRWYLAANVLWSASIDGIRPYVFLFGTIVIGLTHAEVSLMLLPLLLAAALGSVVLGRISDRMGRERILMVSSVAIGLVLAGGVFIRELPLAVLLLSAGGLGASAFLALPYAAFMDRMGAGKRHGANTGLFVISNGVSHLIAPIFIGVAIDLGARVFPEYDGYPVMWPAVGLMALLGAESLRRSWKYRSQ